MGSKWGKLVCPLAAAHICQPGPCSSEVKAAVAGGAGEDTRPLPTEEGQVAPLAGRRVETVLGPRPGLHREDSGQSIPRT